MRSNVWTVPTFPKSVGGYLPPYVIFYRVEKAGINVVRIIHGARDYLQILERQQKPDN